MANFNKPELTSTYTNFITELKGRDNDISSLFSNGETFTGTYPVRAVRWNDSGKYFERRNAANTTFERLEGSGGTHKFVNIEAGSITATSGLSVTGNLSLSGQITAARINVTGNARPANGLYLVSTNKVGLTTNSQLRFSLDSDGNANFTGSVTASSLVGGGLTITGNLSVTGNSTFNGDINTNGNDVVTGNGALISNDSVDPFSDRSGSNIDHLWHNDTDNSWNFVSDSTYKSTGNSKIRAGSFYGNGANLTNLNADKITDGTINALFLPNEIDSDTTGNAATADKLKTARKIANVNFDGSADISLNNNQITNGAGYTTYSANQSLNTSNSPTFNVLTLNGSLTVNANDNISTITMADGNDGHRKIQNNNNQIGFLKQDNNFGAYCDDNGNWTAVGNVTAYSDERLKENIKTIPNALETVKRLRGVTFDRKDFGTKGIGVIAQEIEQVLPEVVVNAEYKSVSYGNIVGLLIEAIKELEKKHKHGL